MVKNVLRDDIKEKEKILEWFLEKRSNRIILKCIDDDKRTHNVVAITPKGQLYLHKGVPGNIGLQIDSTFSIEIEN